MVTPVDPANSTVDAIRQKVRRLTASASENALSTQDIDEHINTFYSQDFPYAIKLDQTRSVYTIFTSPNVDRYPLDINQNQGVRSPVYFEGVQGWFFKDRNDFYRMWPRWPTKSTPISGDGVTTTFNFTISGAPFLSTMVVMGGIDANNEVIRIVDDGGQLESGGNFTTTGNLLILASDTVGNFNPPIPDTSPIPDYPSPPFQPINTIGTVNYVTGAVSITFPVAPKSGTQITCWTSSYSASRPYTILFWNNEFQVRPVPDNVYKIELETYLTPVQFLASTDNPKIKQWWQYIAYGAAVEILRERQDMQGVQNLMEGFQRQEALVLERQGVEEIGQRNSTIFSTTTAGSEFGLPYGWYP